jgi:hypothetical protein
VRTGGEEVKVECRYDREDGLDEGFAARAAAAAGAASSRKVTTRLSGLYAFLYRRCRP